MAVGAGLMVGCQGAGEADGGISTEVLSRTPAAESPLDKLAFMAGGWVPETTQTGKGFGEEHWMAPRGRTMVGMFRLAEPDGTMEFQELTSINVEPAGVFLRMRHVHGAEMIVKPSEAEAQVYKLRDAASLDGSSATFDAVEHTRNALSVTYRRVDAQTLELTVNTSSASGPRKQVIVSKRVRAGM